MKSLFKIFLILIVTTHFGWAQNSSITLKAIKKYNPVEYIDGDTLLSIPVDFVVPSELPVVTGKAGSHKATLKYKTLKGEIVELIYKGVEETDKQEDRL